MKLKTFLAVMCAAFFLNTAADAQVVTVKGNGLSEDAAIKDAKRAAVETVLGTPVKSQSMTVDAELIFDASK